MTPLSAAVLAEPTRRLLADGGAIGAGFIAFVVVVALAVACFFLFRSMARHLRKVPPTFDPPPDPPSQRDAE